MSKAAEFIKRHEMEYGRIDIAGQIDTYLEEMQKGLDGQKSSLLMLPTYLQLKESVRLEEPVICIDAGGTNLRIAIAHFDKNGAFVTEELQRFQMPGVEKMVAAQEFFDLMAQLIAPYCARSKEIVISFAYRARPTEQIDAEIIEITKEVKVEGAEGCLLAKEIVASLASMGIEGVNMIVINDSVATALSGKAEFLNAGYGTFTGTVLGTGSNSCYMEKNENIGKLSGLDPRGVMVINTEAGSYNKMPRSDIDLGYDRQTKYPDLGVTEKMASGGYLGALCGYMLKCAAKEDVFKTKAVQEMRDLKTAEIAEYLRDGSGIIEEYMLDEEDEQNARELLKNVILRAARLVALQMAAVAEKSCKTNNRICMAIEGTTYEKMPFLKEELQLSLRGYLSSRGLAENVAIVKNAVMKGCAIAGLSR